MPTRIYQHVTWFEVAMQLVLLQVQKYEAIQNLKDEA